MKSLLYKWVTDVLSDSFVSVAAPVHGINWLQFPAEQHLNLKRFYYCESLFLEDELLDYEVVGWNRQGMKKNLKALHIRT